MNVESREVPIKRVSNPPKHHFFGYYDKSPWDATGKYMLALEVDFIDHPPTPDDAVTVGIIDLEANCKFEPLAQTFAWCWQQGTMLQWLPSEPDRKIIFNVREGDRFASVIMDIHTGNKRILPRPIYALSPDGKWALSINFARLQITRPGYGYVGLPDPWHNDMHPAEDGIYLMHMDTGKTELIISLAQIANFNREPRMDGVKHWFNHLLFNPDSTRFIFLHRWHREGGGLFTRMFTADYDGKNIYCLADHDMVSHFDWRDSNHILAWARIHRIGDFYYLFTDRSRHYEIVGKDVLTCDGHCSYSPDGRWILTDTYPDEEHKRTLILYNPENNHRIDIGRFYSPPELSGEIRCDLHPRWNRDGTQVCIDSAHEGHRQMYVLDVSDITSG
ncbi:MAG TPA: hypothetical protein EYP10_01195 [Armatimonadetes bacterium]|nr:hypothetical protein [Armatimonadota bacterium]